MDATDNTRKAKTPKQATGTNDDTVMAASSAASDRPFGPDGATILATEHWSLLGGGCGAGRCGRWLRAGSGHRACGQRPGSP